MSLQNLSYQVAAKAKEGAPVDWLKISPTMTVAGNAGLLKRAQHPNAAKLFISFLVSPEGQKVYQQAGYIPANPDVPPLDPAASPTEQGIDMAFFAADESASSIREWLSIYKELFQK